MLAKLRSGIELAAIAPLTSRARLLLVTEKGATKHLTAASLPELGRAAMGKSLIALRKRDRVKQLLVL